MTTGGAYSAVGKRLLDLLLCVPMVLLTSPLIGCLALLVRFALGRPVIYRQTRPGLNGQPFTMYKFRSMRDVRDAQGQLLPDSVRLTAVGRILRRTSMDELPELWNVIRGDMSLVGPRPLLMHYLERYEPEQARRHGVRPGITGWAQINGRNLLTWEKKFEYDVWYVDNLSLWLDLKILTITAWQVIRRQGISPEGTATMPEFRGTKR